MSELDADVRGVGMAADSEDAECEYFEDDDVELGALVEPETTVAEEDVERLVELDESAS